MSKRFPWLCAVFIGGAALLSLSACSDSSSVGLGVGPDSLRGGAPVTLDVRPNLDTTRISPITGENTSQPTARSAWRFLVGVVDDPVPGTGTVEAEGYVDFSGRSTLPFEILSADNVAVLSAELRLTTDYLHGLDEPMDVTVYDLSEEAEMDSARANVSFDTDRTEPASVDAAQINPTDSLVTIELRQSWIRDNLAVLRDTTNGGDTFEDNFPGFKIVASASQSVVGFSSTDATLRLIHTPDSTTADYPSQKTFTHIEQRNVTNSPPSNHELLIGGVGVDLSMEWAYGEEEFQEEARSGTPIDSLPADSGRALPLNRAEIFVPVDTLALNDFSESNFVRPTPGGFRLLATRAPDPDIPPCTVILQAQGLAAGDRACAVPLAPSAIPSGALVSNNVAFPVFQQSFRRVGDGRSPVFTTYRLQVADRDGTSQNPLSTTQLGLPSTLPVLVQRPASPSQDPGPPRATLTVTPL